MMFALHYLFLFSMLYLSIFHLLKVDKKRNILVINLVLLSLLLLIEFLVGSYNLHQNAPTAIYDLAYTMFANVIILFMINNIRKLPVVLLVNIFLMIIVTVGAGLLFTLLDWSVMQLTTSPKYSLVGVLAGSILFLVLYSIIKLMKIHKAKLGFRGLGLLTVSTISYGYYLTSPFIGGEDRANVILLLSAIGGILPIVGVILFILNSNKLRESRYREEMYAHNFSLQKNHYQSLYEKEEQTKKFQHDYKKQLGTLKNLLAENKLDEMNEYLNGIIGKADQINAEFKFQSGSDFVDASLNQILANVKYTNVKFNRQWTIPDDLIMDSIDITSLFVNLLTNAFDAAIMNTEDSFVDVKISARSDFLYIGIENNYSGNLIVENGEFKTTKSKASVHGYGLQIVKDIVEKYNGDVAIEYDDKVFLIEITFGQDIYRSSDKQKEKLKS